MKRLHPGEIVSGRVVYKNPALCLNKVMMAGENDRKDNIMDQKTGSTGNGTSGADTEKDKSDNQNTKEQLASHIVDYVRDELLISLPFLNRAILKMPVRFSAKPDPTPEVQNMNTADERQQDRKSVV